MERKRSTKPPEKTLPNDEKMIEAEKEKSDQQSMLRWTMAGANDNRKSRAEDANTGREESAQQKTAKSEQIEGKR